MCIWDGLHREQTTIGRAFSPQVRVCQVNLALRARLGKLLGPWPEFNLPKSHSETVKQ